MFEAVAFEFHSAKPAGDGDDGVGAVFFLEDAEDDHPSAGFAVVTFGLVDGTFVAKPCGPAVVVGFGVLLVGFEGFQKLLDVFPTLHQANGSGVATPSIFNDEMKEREGRFGFTGVAEVELGGLEGHGLHFITAVVR